MKVFVTFRKVITTLDRSHVFILITGEYFLHNAVLTQFIHMLCEFLWSWTLQNFPLSACKLCEFRTVV